MKGHATKSWAEQETLPRIENEAVAYEWLYR